jgi:hypothetical protein
MIGEESADRWVRPSGERGGKTDEWSSVGSDQGEAWD